MNLTSLLRRLFRRERMSPAARERIRRALWREITRREWARHCDQRQDNGNGYEMGWFEGMKVGLQSDAPDGLAAGVQHHRTLVGLVEARQKSDARRRGGKL